MAMLSSEVYSVVQGEMKGEMAGKQEVNFPFYLNASLSEFL